jgi:hypothetical protein
MQTTKTLRTSFSKKPSLPSPQPENNFDHRLKVICGKALRWVYVNCVFIHPSSACQGIMIIAENRGRGEGKSNLHTPTSNAYGQNVTAVEKLFSLVAVKVMKAFFKKLPEAFWQLLGGVFNA